MAVAVTPIAGLALGVRHGSYRDATVNRHDVDDRVRKSRQQVASSARVVDADRPNLGTFDDPLNRRNQLGTEVVAGPRLSLVVPANRGLGTSRAADELGSRSAGG